jgi:hypothetical protein
MNASPNQIQSLADRLQAITDEVRGFLQLNPQYTYTDDELADLLAVSATNRGLPHGRVENLIDEIREHRARAAAAQQSPPGATP